MKTLLQEKKLDLPTILTELVNNNIVCAEEAENILTQPRGSRDLAKHPLTYLSEQQMKSLVAPSKLLTAHDLCQWLSSYSDMPLYTINPLKIDAAAITQVMSFGFARQHEILAVEVHRDEVVVACAQPFKRGWIDNLQHVLNKSIKTVVADPADIERFGTEFYTLANSISGANQGLEHTRQSIEAFMQLGQLKEPDASDQNIVTIVDWLFQYAFEQRASDIHIEPRKTQGHIRFRIDGVLHAVYAMPMQPLLAVTSRIKTMGRMNIAEKRKPQDGRLKTKTPEGQEIDLRLSTIPTAFGEKLVIRIFDPEVLLKTFTQLGLASQEFRHWQAMTARSNGILLVTGPTGSGKTTTLYSTLKSMATPDVNVCTIEDPIEMIEDSFNQIQVHHAIDLDFAAGVKALLRQDPDIIMIGEIRDKETAHMAVQAALTGHLVLSTLHTNDAPSAVTRLLEIGLPAYLVRATLVGVMAQRLVRTLCPDCKQEGAIDQQLWQELVAPFKVEPPEKGFYPVGCLACRNTGYKGRSGIYEILQCSQAIQGIIRATVDTVELRHRAMKDGMRTLRLSGARKVAAGVTTIEEVMRVAPQSFEL